MPPGDLWLNSNESLPRKDYEGSSCPSDVLTFTLSFPKPKALPITLGMPQRAGADFASTIENLAIRSR